MVVAIIPAAGYGKRLQFPIPKQFLPVHNVPLVVHTLRLLERVPEIGAVVVAVSSEYTERLQQLCRDYNLCKVCRIVSGGAERQDSVANALRTEEARKAEYLIIHDAVRPLAPPELFQRVLQAAQRYGAAIPGIPPSDTIKEITLENTVRQTLPRERLRLIQTPQAFRRELLEEAYRAAMQRGWYATDDAALVEALGHPVAVVEGAWENIKITHPSDIALAEYLLARQRS